MATASQPKTAFPSDWSLADLRRHLGGIPLKRIRLFPPPGLATERDVIRLNDREDKLFELVDGILVEKAMGFYESLIAGVIVIRLGAYVEKQKSGKVLGADAAMKILSSQIRIPDVSFVSWDRLPRGRSRRTPIPAVVPNLAVEVLSPSNTKKEMLRKLDEYFRAGVQLVWIIDPDVRTAVIYTSAEKFRSVKESGSLDGGVVLPGFKLSLRELFASADEEGPEPAK